MLKYGLDQIFDLDRGWLALNIGNYAMQLIEYKDMYKKGRLIIVDFNELINDTKKCLEKICRKIDIEFDEFSFKNLNIERNETNEVVPKITNHSVFPFVKKVYNKAPNFFRKKFRLMSNFLLNQDLLPKRLLTETEKLRLGKIYKPTLIQLKKEFGIDYHEKSWTSIKKYI